MAAFADALPGIGGFYFWDTGVVDQTKLKGSWDFDFRFTPQTALAGAGTEAVKIFDAVDKQLGVEKLDLTKLPLAVLVVVDGSVNEKAHRKCAGCDEEKVPAAPTTFEVADIKPSNPNSNQPRPVVPVPARRVNIRNSTLKQLIAYAGRLECKCRSRRGSAEILADTDRFDIVAKYAVGRKRRLPSRSIHRFDARNVACITGGWIASRLPFTAQINLSLLMY